CAREFINDDAVGASETRFVGELDIGLRSGREQHQLGRYLRSVGKTHCAHARFAVDAGESRPEADIDTALAVETIKESRHLPPAPPRLPHRSPSALPPQPRRQLRARYNRRQR